VGEGCCSPVLWVHISQKALCDPKQTTPEKGGAWARFLRPQGKVPGDGLPGGNSRSRQRETGGGPEEVSLGHPDAPGRGGGKSAVSLGAQGLRKPPRRVRKKQVSKIACTPTSPPGRGWKKGRGILDGPVLGPPETPGRASFPEVGTCDPDSHVRPGR
jgi:hypothetical protein